MGESGNSLWQSLGFLRLALISLALINALLAIVNLRAGAFAISYHGLWNLLTTVIAPVMAPLLTVLLLFEYIMSRVRAADAEGARRELYIKIGRIELAVMLLTLAIWVPFFINLVS